MALNKILVGVVLLALIASTVAQLGPYGGGLGYQNGVGYQNDVGYQRGFGSQNRNGYGSYVREREVETHGVGYGSQSRFGSQLGYGSSGGFGRFKRQLRGQGGYGGGSFGGRQGGFGGRQGGYGRRG